MRRIARVAIAIGVLLLATSGSAQVAIPPVARVTDLTDTLSAASRQRIESELAALEKEKGSQVAVLVVPTTQPDDIAPYALRVAEAWKLGRKGVDDGALFLVAKNDHRIRIEVGYGLEGALNDATSKRIIDEYVVPRFRAGDFDGGIETGVDRIVGVVHGEPLPPPPARRPSGSTGTGSPLGSVGTMVLFGGIVVGTALRSVFGRLLGSMASGVGVTALSALLGTPLVWSLGFGLVALLFVLFGSFGRRGFYVGGGPYVGGGFGGGFGGGGGGGGFSGGGGSFGGGGASGSW